jgi:CSLREA domain-containing protein
LRPTLALGVVALALTLTSAARAETFTVTSTADDNDVCAGTSCHSLRAAITAANGEPGADTIVLGAGTYRIEKGAASEDDDNESGDLDVLDDLTVRGAGAQATTILGDLPGGKKERDIDVPGNASLTLADLTVSGGDEGEDAKSTTGLGGGVASLGNGTLTLEHVVVSRNSASGQASFGRGGGVDKEGGLLIVENSALLENEAHAAGEGGAVYSGLGTTVRLANVLVAGNRSDGSGGIAGGIQLEQGPSLSTLAFVTVEDNSATNEGGGLLASPSLELRDSIIAANNAPNRADCGLFGVVSAGGNVLGPSCAPAQASDAIVANPLLGPLEGSPIPYVEPLGGSPALDRAIGACPATDVRGVARPQGSACDAGAVERVVVPSAGGGAAGGGSAPADAKAKAPTLSAVYQSHSRWRLGHKLASVSGAHAPVGTVFSFTLDQPATVTLGFTQSVRGRRVKGRCVAPIVSNRARRPCRRTVTRGTLVLAGRAGSNRVSFQGRVSARKKLVPGAYTVLIAATGAGGHSKTQRLSFTIVG